MNDNIKDFIKKAILELIDNTTSDTKIKSLVKKHVVKVHFIPIRYRIFTGLLQSMNIQFGNFIEKLLHIIVEHEEHLNVDDNISGKRNIKLPMTKKSEKLIDEYITDCQNNSYNSDELLRNFNELIDECLSLEKEPNTKEINISHDIDVLFSNEDDIFYYLEVKYNDDHDTGKYADINRKFIKSYIGISNVLEVYDKEKFKPILYYMTPKRMKGNIYLPEQENIYRGDKLFKEFFSVEYNHLDTLIKNIGDDSDIIKIFDDLHYKIRNELAL